MDKKTKTQLAIIIGLGVVALALLCTAIVLACSGNGGTKDTPKDSAPDSEWTQNY